MRDRKKSLHCKADADLDDYTYRVAGCVGEFWTKMCRAHVFPTRRLDDAELLRDGVRFGKGLQLVNILRDLPRDLKQGRCYLPLERLARVQLQPDDLAMCRPSTSCAQFTMSCWIVRTLTSWPAGITPIRFPRSAVRIRLACAWADPDWGKDFGAIANGQSPGCGAPREVSRAEVSNSWAATLWKYPFPRAWQRLFEQARL